MSEIFKQRRNGEELARCSAQVGGSGTTHPCQHAALQPPFRERCRDHIFHTPSSPLFQLAACVMSAAEASKGIECTKCQFSCTQTTSDSFCLRSTHTELHTNPPISHSRRTCSSIHDTLISIRQRAIHGRRQQRLGLSITIAATRTLAPHTPTLSELLLCPAARPCPHTNLTHSREAGALRMSTSTSQPASQPFV
jgi:hypothetical protein